MSSESFECRLRRGGAGQAARTTIAIDFFASARALKYSRRLGRGRLAPQAREIPRSPISAPCGCGGSAECAECARLGETEASLPDGAKAGRALANRNRALANADAAARPADLVAEDRAAWQVTRSLANGKATVTQRARGLCSATPKP